jgi:uncharacterized protein (DUF1330 family)
MSLEEPSMPAYVLAHIDVTDPENYQDYVRMVPHSVTHFGGRFLARGPAPEILEGTWVPKRLVLIEFPSVEHARTWWASPEYAAATAKRQATSTGDLIILAGV